jgi:hypothetical protein
MTSRPSQQSVASSDFGIGRSQRWEMDDPPGERPLVSSKPTLRPLAISRSMAHHLTALST